MHISNQIKTFDYLGSKFSILPWLLPQLPACNHYISVFGGAASDLINRDPSPIETYNDLNGNVVNFFSVLRNKSNELIAALELTLHSRQEYSNAWYCETDTDIEKARKFFIRTQQSIYAAGAQDKVKGWAASLTQSRVSISEKTHRWIRGVNGLWEVAERLKHVQIECKDFKFILKHYNDKGTLFYCDPPYDMTFRSSTKYEFDFTNQDFLDLHYWASKVKGKIAISGYDTAFMRELFTGFNFHKGPMRKNNRSNKEAKECLWTNY
jgi:DNA adenine methylase